MTQLYRRAAALRDMLTVASLGVAIVPLSFLSQAPVARLLRATDNVALASTRPSRTPPVVVVVFDQLPLASLLDGQGDIDQRYPHFAALAGDSIWLRNASSVGLFTEWALPTILTGRYPAGSRLPTADDHPENLFTLLGGTYRIHAIEPITALCPPALCARTGVSRVARLASAVSDLAILYLHLVLPSTLSTGLPPVTQNWKGFTNLDIQERWADARDDDRRETPRAWIQAIEPSEEPTLHFLHVLLPHEPFEYLPTGQGYVTSAAMLGLREGRWSQDVALVAGSYQQHLLQLGFVDTLVGELTAHLRATGIYDETLLIVTSDHGASFRPGRLFRGLSPQTLAEQMAVPLFVKPPAHAGPEVVDANVETIDVLPTIADVLDLRVPWDVDGRSVLSSLDEERPSKRIYYDDGRAWSSVAGVLDLERAVAYKEELFGTSDAFIRGPRRAPGTEIVDMPLASLAVSPPSDLTVTLDSPGLFGRVDPRGPFVPARVSGSIDGTAASEPIDLAVAVNGAVRAIAHVGAAAAGPRRWAAVVDPAAFRPGRNEVEVFGIESADGPLRLVATSRRPVTPDERNLAMEGSLGDAGIQVSGFHRQEWLGDALVRCTDGHGRVVVPLDPDRPPAALRVSIARTAPGHSNLRILLDGCALVDERVPAGRWDDTLRLDACRPRGRTATIEIVSDAVVQRDGRRRLGACVSALFFVDD